jgi:hypothetical protein
MSSGKFVFLTPVSTSQYSVPAINLEPQLSVLQQSCVQNPSLRQCGGETPDVYEERGKERQ